MSNEAQVSDDDEDAIDQQTGMVNVYQLLPEAGDCLTIINLGTHFELRHHKVVSMGALGLTDDEIAKIQQGKMIWN